MALKGLKMKKNYKYLVPLAALNLFMVIAQAYAAPGKGKITRTGYTPAIESNRTGNAPVKFIAPPSRAFIATPIVAYVTPQVYTVGTAIATLNPTTSGVSADGTYGTGASFGSTYSGPEAIALDASANVYVTNVSNNTVRKFNSSGVFQSTIGTGLNGPYGVALDASNNAYISNYGSNTIVKVTSAGVQSTFVSSGLNNPFGVATDASGNVYVANYTSSNVQKYSSSGSLLLSISNTGAIDAAVDASGNIFVLSYTNGTITKYNSSGGVVSTFTPNVSGLSVAGAFGLALDPSGNIYIADSNNNRVLIYNSSYTLIANIASSSTPRGVVVDSFGNMYVTLNSSNAVYKYAPTGGYFINAKLPAGLSFNSSTGAITGTPTAASAAANYTVTAYGSSGSTSATVNITVNSPATPTLSYATPQTYTVNTAITTLSPVSTGAGTYGSYGTGTTFVSGNNEPTDIAFDASGNAYVPNFGANTISKYSSTGTYLSTVGSGLNEPLSLVFDASGNLYETDYGSSSIIKITSAGVQSTLITGLNQPYETALDASGNIYVANYGGNGVLKYSSTGTLISFIEDAGANGVAIDANGNIDILSISTNTVKKFSSGGTLISTLTPNVSGSGLSNPLGLKLDAAGNIYIADYGNNRVLEYNSSYTLIANLPVSGARETGIDASGNIYGVLYGSNAIDKFAPTGGYFINKALQAGLSFSNTTGAISGTPTAASVATTYTVTAFNAASVSTSTTLSITVNAAPLATFTATTPVDINSNCTVTLSNYVATSTYSWNFGGGTPSTGTGQGPFSVQWTTAGTKTITLTVTDVSGHTNTATQTVSVNGTTYGNYAFKRTITLNTAAVGITSTLTNFPALLSIQSNDLIITGNCTDKLVNPSGPNYDFAFVAPGAATECYYQVVSYNQTTGTLLVWVQMPSISPSINNTVAFYYGSAAPTVTHNAAFFQKTWASDYQAVYNFEDAVYSGGTYDATVNAGVGVLSGFNSTFLVTGKVGKAYVFGSGSTTTNLTASGANVSGAFTISAWVNLNTIGIDQKVLTNESSSGEASGGYKLGVYVDNIPESEGADNVNRGNTPNSAAVTTGSWYYLQSVYDGATLSTFVNGVQYKEEAVTGTVPSTLTTLYVGIGEGGGYPFSGIIDEARVSNVAKSSDWILMEYNNQNNPVSFTTVGTGVDINYTYSAVIKGSVIYTWSGATSTDPGVAGNWNNTTNGATGSQPAFDGSTTLVIPAGLTNYPKLTANASLYDINIASGASLNLNGYTLTVGCNIYNSAGGQILYGTTTASGITFNGSLANQYYYGSTTAATGQTGALTINNTAGGTVTISGGPLDVYTSLTITKGNLVVGASPAALTLKSTATQTAGVAAIPSGYSISGTVACERYVSGGSGYRGYRLVTSPVYAATSGANNLYSINYLQNAMYLTGSAGGGFDKTGNPSLYLYREDQTPSRVTFTSGNYWGISAINLTPTYNYDLNGGTSPSNLPIGNGILVFFRGNRASATVAAETVASYTSPVAATLSTSGTLTQGTVTVRNWYYPTSANIGYTGSGTGGNYTVRGFNLVGNPYASSIDWSTFSNTSSSAAIYGANVGPTVWTLDPTTKNFDTYNATTGIATGHASKIIASGQGFFVQAVAASPTLTFQEAAKTTTQPTGTGLMMDKRIAANTLAPSAYASYIRLKLVTDTVNFSDMVVGFNPKSAETFNTLEDSRFASGMGNLQAISAISSDNIKVSAKWVPLPKGTANLVVPINVFESASGQYTLQRTDLMQVSPLYEIWLMDKHNKDSLDIKNNTNYVFDVDLADTTSYGANRFEVVIRQNQALMVHLLNFTAVKASGGSQVGWVTENEANYTNFSLQRSTDGGKTYQMLDSLLSSGQGTYGYLDANPVNGANTYRLQMTDLNGGITYSSIVTIMYGNTSNSLAKTGMIVYPNPAISTVNVNFAPGLSSASTTSSSKVAASLAYNVQITSMVGGVVKTATVNQQTWQTDVTNLLPGTYIIQVTNKTDNSIVGEQKFVKL
jgi:hypothetical protein